MDPLFEPMQIVDSLYTVTEIDSTYDYDRCKQTYDNGLYKMQIDILDSSATASILCWDPEAEILAGIPCQDLYQKFIETRNCFEDIPDELGSLIDQTFLFRVTVKENQVHKESSVFTVIGLETDPTLVANYTMFTRER
ncbi:hypothetical protein CASFOL_028103 [Castilleja foliolosa]|uniref:Replication factor A C-terminal domain-containing protein n=1 Tax=Castilleja foliolosa TaxID=1961234 RepID=A0ABD3CG43_9LAMI